MISVQINSDTTLLNQQAQQYFIKGDYSHAANYYEQAIEAEPEVKTHYWNLGLMLLLQKQEAEAQMTWMLGMADGEPQQVEQWTIELLAVLQTEAERRQTLADYSVAWAIRQHIREINPIDVNNLLYLIELAIQLETFTGDELNSLGVIELLQSEEIVDIQLLLQVFENILNYAPLHPLLLEFAEACLAHVCESKSFINILVPATVKIAQSMWEPKIAAQLIELGLKLEPQNIEILRHLTAFYLKAGDYSQGIETAKLCYSLSTTLLDQIFATHLLQRGLMDAPGYWEEAYSILQQQEDLLQSLIAEKPTNIVAARVLRLFNANYFAPYLRDDPYKNRQIQNQVAQLCQLNVQQYASEVVQRYQLRNSKKRNKLIKIGYLSHCLSRHSVGWLARWLIQHHNHDKFDIYGYFVNYKQINDPLQEWYTQQFTQAYKGGIYSEDIAEKFTKMKLIF